MTLDLRPVSRTELLQQRQSVLDRIAATRAAYLDALAAAETAAAAQLAALTAAKRAIGAVNETYAADDRPLQQELASVEQALVASAPPVLGEALARIEGWRDELRRRPAARPPSRDLWEALAAARDRLEALRLTAPSPPAAADAVALILAPLEPLVQQAFAS